MRLKLRSHGRGSVAPENSLRIMVFYRLLPQASAFARRRQEAFMRVLEIKSGSRVLDLGGSRKFWNDVPVPLDVAILNLPGAFRFFELNAERKSIPTFNYV